MIKVRIQNGQNSIDLEGEIADVSAVLERYWTPNAVSSEPVVSVPSDDSATSKARSRPKRKLSPSADQSGKQPSLDAEFIANKIKTDPRFSAIKTKILDVSNEWIAKCKLIALVSGEPITSGDVHRILTQLRIKCVLSTLSKTLSGNSSDFLTRGSNPVKYELTAPAQQAFEKWLSDA